MMVYINGVGAYVPERVLTNAELSSMVDTSDEWITVRTGIKERRIVSHGQACSDLAFEASKRALKDANIIPSEITHLIVATCTADKIVPSTACHVACKLELNSTVAAFDISAACSGFIYALEMGRALATLHPEAVILLVGSEVLTSKTNFQDRSTCILFGDGAGAVVLSTKKTDKSALIVDCLLQSDGKVGHLLEIPAGGSAKPYVLGEVVGSDSFITMQGREVFKYGVRSMASAVENIIAKNNFELGDINLLIPHQANLRIIESIAEKLKINMDNVFINLDKTGNTSAASIPIALAEAVQTNRIAQGDLLALVAFGGGLTWGSALLRY